VIFTSNLDGPGSHPSRPNGGRLVASLDVEWTKNYKVPNGNRAFCYSVVWLAIPDLSPCDPDALDMGYTSAYVEHDKESYDLVASANEELSAVLNLADVLVGHQLCSDLGILVANATPPGDDPTPQTLGAWPPASVAATRDAWRSRRTTDRLRVVDTRYDVGHLLAGRSRRLVDVCEELHLDVTQPELGSRSMTALHRDWLDEGSAEARERITVLNLRHSLSAALVALRALDACTWTGRLNVNRILDRHLHGAFAWLDHPTFQALLDR
jgi:hypothetical protein